MSKAYRESFTSKPSREEFRKWLCPKFEYNEDGTPKYRTEQDHQKECDINYIMRKYDKEKVVTHFNKFAALYADLTGDDFKATVDHLKLCQTSFDELPSKIRKRFNNSPEYLIRFLEDPANRTEAATLGLIESVQEPLKAPPAGSTPKTEE